jgi:hypothetical protein
VDKNRWETKGVSDPRRGWSGHLSGRVRPGHVIRQIGAQNHGGMMPCPTVGGSTTPFLSPPPPSTCTRLGYLYSDNLHLSSHLVSAFATATHPPGGAAVARSSEIRASIRSCKRGSSHTNENSRSRVASTAHGRWPQRRGSLRGTLRPAIVANDTPVCHPHDHGCEQSKRDCT